MGRSGPRRRGPLVVAAVSGAIVLGACGGAAHPPAADSEPEPRTRDEQLAARQVEAFLAAMQAHDDASACATMTPTLQRAITTELRLESEPGTCRTRAADIYSPAKAPGNADATVRNVTAVGDRATATVTATATGELATGAVESVVRLKRHGHRWLIADF
jgi:hypothetical protein